MSLKDPSRELFNQTSQPPAKKDRYFQKIQSKSSSKPKPPELDAEKRLAQTKFDYFGDQDDNEIAIKQLQDKLHQERLNKT